MCHACQAGTWDRRGQLLIHKAFFKSEPEESKVASEQRAGLLRAGGRTQPGTQRKGVAFLTGKPPAGPVSGSSTQTPRLIRTGTQLSASLVLPRASPLHEPFEGSTNVPT